MDAAHKWTDKRIEELERKIRKEYSAAAKEMRKIAKERLKDYAEQRSAAREALKSGRITKEAFKSHMSTLAVAKARDRELLNALTSVALTPKTSALKLIAFEAPEVYAENANFATFLIEKATRLDTAFTLIDTGTVRKLFEANPKLLPVKTTVNEAKDILWHSRKFVSSITQSILLGESVPDTAKRLSGVLETDARAAMSTARTALTAAENMGRMDSYERAERMGIRGVKVWEATLDGRTRDSHRQADGERIPIDEAFSNGLMQPGDPDGEPEEVYNCRCAMRYEVDDVEQETVNRFSRLPSDVSYDDWKAGHYHTNAAGRETSKSKNMRGVR